jgi:hypothetical protein
MRWARSANTNPDYDYDPIGAQKQPAKITHQQYGKTSPDKLLPPPSDAIAHTRPEKNTPRKLP